MAEYCSPWNQRVVVKHYFELLDAPQIQLPILSSFDEFAQRLRDQFGIILSARWNMASFCRCKPMWR